MARKTKAAETVPAWVTGEVAAPDFEAIRAAHGLVGGPPENEHWLTASGWAGKLRCSDATFSERIATQPGWERRKYRSTNGRTVWHYRWIGKTQSSAGKRRPKERA